MKSVFKFIITCLVFVWLWLMMIVCSILMPILTLFRVEVKMKVTRK